MFLNINIKTIFRICFYLILIAVCISSWIKLLRVPTAFEEKVVYNQARLPSFTLCPREVDDTNRNELIESFEYIDKAIKNVRYKYTIRYEEYKAYEEIKTVEINYTDTSYGVWYFVPKISMMSPFEAVICLIWTPSREYKLKSDWGLRVSHSNFKFIQQFTYVVVVMNLLLYLVHNIHGFITITILCFTISRRK